ncbi:centromere protein J [Stegastes partitus]|uniref:Centromere protein J n=1 Tax=Stegastes partitus TaxID=144197 RepID=A0A9Y4JZL9_9TELE|nr:PREDICTED: centromere protein J [Stegastes partitus]
MSSPAELHYSQADFLARWMPSSTRAGVILNPSPDLAGPLRHVSAVGSPPLKPDDSFASDFAPLPASADSSCLGVDGFARSLGEERAGVDRPVNGLVYVPTTNTDGQLNSLDEIAGKSQDLPLNMKLEQLRKWQQHMQEQLKAHQLEELLRLQEEQQRLLGIMNGSQHCVGEYAESSGALGAEWGEDTLHRTSHYGESSSSSNMSCHGVTQGLRQEQQPLPRGRQEQLLKHQGHVEVEDEEEGMWNSREDDEEQSVDSGHFPEDNDMLIQHNGVTTTDDNSRREDKVSHDRPIRPGIGGQKQTFEELLEEQLWLEEQRLKSVQQQKSPDEAEAAQAPPKRAFLKRGEGLSRFTNNPKAPLHKIEVKNDPKPQPRAKVMSRSNSEPASIQKSSANGVPRLPVQRKTATLNKENRLRGLSSPPQDMRAESKAARTKVLGSYQRQNTEGTESIPTDPDIRQTKQHQLWQGKEQNNRKVRLSVQTTKNSFHNMQPNPVTKQLGMLGGPGKAENDATKEKSYASKVKSAQERAGTEGGDGAPQDSFELSFQEKLHHWECNQHLENMELGEFELLEQAAEELSFSSNSSFVMKVLQMDQHQRQLQAARGLHQRRLSSTPIKSPPRDALRRCSSVGSSKNSSVISEGFVETIRDDALKARVSSGDKEREGEDKRKISDMSSCSGSEFGDQEVVVKSSCCFPAPTNPPYDKRSYQDEDISRDLASDVAQEEDQQSDVSNDDDSTVIEDKDSQQQRVVFDDDDTWNDLEDTAIGTANQSTEVSPVSKPAANRVSPPERTLLRKVAVSKVVELHKGPVNLEPDPPPASQLMTRLFPSLKPKAQNAPGPPPPAASVASEFKKPEEETVQQVQSRQLRERLVELEIEIERFKKENAALTKLRQENEKNQENLRKERLAFEQTKAEELAKFEEYKKDENKKLQKERKLFEKHALAARAVPDKKEREEIQVLKQQLSSLQEELRRRESRWTSTHSRLRQQVDSLSQENASLRDEIRMLEKLRLSTLKKNPVAAPKETETKEGLKISENNVSSVSKGVTFASPLDSRGSSSSSSPPQSSAAAATRRNTIEGSQSVAAMKSSLRRPSGQSSSSSSSLPVRRTEERSAAASKSQEKSPNQEHFDNGSPKRDSPQKQPECNEANEPESAQEVITHPDGKIEKVLVSGDRLIVFPNGTRKEVSADGLDGTKEIHFNTGQKEIHTADYKRREYPDGTVKTVYSDGRQETRYPTGRLRIKDKDGNVILDNGA